MAFKKLIWHFYVAVAFHRLPRSGRVLLALHCSNSLRAPLPLPLEGPAQDSRESGRAWGEPGASFRAGRGRGRGRPLAGGWPRGAREAGNDPRAPAVAAPGFPPHAPGRDTKTTSLASLAIPGRPPPTCHCS